MSRRTEAKKARRKKRQAGRDSRWLPEAVLDDLAELTLDVQDFNDLILLRGWTIDQEFSGDGLVTWFYEPSGIQGGDDDVEPVTRIWVAVDDGGELVHTVLVGTAEEAVLTPEEFFEHVEAIEAHRFGDPAPQF